MFRDTDGYLSPNAHHRPLRRPHGKPLPRAGSMVPLGGKAPPQDATVVTDFPSRGPRPDRLEWPRLLQYSVLYGRRTGPGGTCSGWLRLRGRCSCWPRQGVRALSEQTKPASLDGSVGSKHEYRALLPHPVASKLDPSPVTYTSGSGQNWFWEKRVLMSRSRSTREPVFCCAAAQPVTASTAAPSSVTSAAAASRQRAGEGMADSVVEAGPRRTRPVRRTNAAERRNQHPSRGRARPCWTPVRVRYGRAGVRARVSRNTHRLSAARTGRPKSGP